MSSPVGILGAGFVTPCGPDPDGIREAVWKGKRPAPGTLDVPPGRRPLPVLRVAPTCEVRHPRLRRASAVSHFAAAAALAASGDHGAHPPERTALVLAATDGTVIYSRRFFEEVMRSGTGSPLLFPETVYNAAASHVAAMLGIDGCVLTLVGDATSGADALATALDILEAGEAERCLVVASQEVDWVALEGYRRWGLVSGRGAVLAEGACALLLGPAGPGDVLLRSLPPVVAAKPADSAEGLRQICADLGRAGQPDLAVLSDSGAGNERIEANVVSGAFPEARQVFPKAVLGEAFSASTLLQVGLAGEAVRRGASRCAAVTVIGWSGQSGGVLLTASCGGG